MAVGVTPTTQKCGRMNGRVYSSEDFPSFCNTKEGNTERRHLAHGDGEILFQRISSLENVVTLPGGQLDFIDIVTGLFFILWVIFWGILSVNREKFQRKKRFYESMVNYAYCMIT